MSLPRRSARASTPTSPAVTAKKTAPTGARKSSSGTPAPLSARPALPLYAKNTLMADWKGKLHKVKSQTLRLGFDDETILIARVKCPVPKNVPGHIIKRFDTNAVSASSLFRAAFPVATDEEESIEMHWIARDSRGRYGNTEAAGAEHDETRKLSGTWIPAAKAMSLSIEYSVERFAKELINFVYVEPEPEESAPVESENETQSVSSKSPRAKRQRVASPVLRSSLSAAPSITAVIAPEVVAMEVVETVVETVVEEVVVEESSLALDAVAAAEVAAAKAMVESLKQEQLPASVTSTKTIKKRVISDVTIDDEVVPAVAPTTLHDVLVADNRGMFGKIFRRAPVGSKRAAHPGRVIRAGGSQIALVEREVEAELQRPERRWIAGLGLALAIGATAAAPYLLG